MAIYFQAFSSYGGKDGLTGNFAYKESRAAVYNHSIMRGLQSHMENKRHNPESRSNDVSF